MEAITLNSYKRHVSFHDLSSCCKLWCHDKMMVLPKKALMSTE